MAGVSATETIAAVMEAATASAPTSTETRLGVVDPQ